MTAPGQKAKNSNWAYVVRVTPDNGHCTDVSGRPRCAGSRHPGNYRWLTREARPANPSSYVARHGNRAVRL